MYVCMYVLVVIPDMNMLMNMNTMLTVRLRDYKQMLTKSGKNI